MPDKKTNHILWLDELEAKGLLATQLKRIKSHPKAVTATMRSGNSGMAAGPKWLKA